MRNFSLSYIYICRTNSLGDPHGCESGRRKKKEKHVRLPFSNSARRYQIDEEKTRIRVRKK